LSTSTMYLRYTDDHRSLDHSDALSGTSSPPPGASLPRLRREALGAGVDHPPLRGVRLDQRRRAGGAGRGSLRRPRRGAAAPGQPSLTGQAVRGSFPRSIPAVVRHGRRGRAPAAGTPRTGVSARGRMSRNKTILLVEDNPSVLHLME